MAYKRRTFRKTPYTRRKGRGYYFRGTRPVAPFAVGAPLKGGIMRQKVHNFKRTVYLEKAIQYMTNGAITPASSHVYTWSLADIPNMVEFQNLFDRYKLNAVKVVFQCPVDSWSSVSPGIPSRLHTVLDYDDNTPLPVATALQQALEYESYKCLTFGSNRTSVSRYIKPRIARQIYQSTLATAYEVAKPAWIDLSNPTVPHFGMKVYADNQYADLNTGARDMFISMKTTYYFQCRDVR